MPGRMEQLKVGLQYHVTHCRRGRARVEVVKLGPGNWVDVLIVFGELTGVTPKNTRKSGERALLLFDEAKWRKARS